MGREIKTEERSWGVERHERLVLTPLGVKNSPPAVLTFDLAECRPQGQPMSVERQCCRYLLRPGVLLLYNPPLLFYAALFTK